MDEWKYMAMFMFLKYLSRAASRNCLQTQTSADDVTSFWPTGR
jgi:hypothetical protein